MRTPAWLGRMSWPALGLAAAVALTGCGSGHSAAAPRPPSVPGEATAGPDLTGVKLPDLVLPLARGGVARPVPALTPGAVASTDTAALCRMPDHLSGQTIAKPVQQDVFAKYGLTHGQAKYQLDYLVPIYLGGAKTAANIWPAAVKGTGFFQKTQLDHILRDMVCSRQIPITTAQNDLETNWYVAWLRYVAEAGRA